MVNQEFNFNNIHLSEIYDTLDIHPILVEDVIDSQLICINKNDYLTKQITPLNLEFFNISTITNIRKLLSNNTLIRGNYLGIYFYFSTKEEQKCIIDKITDEYVIKFNNNSSLQLNFRYIGNLSNTDIRLKITDIDTINKIIKTPLSLYDDSIQKFNYKYQNKYICFTVDPGRGTALIPLILEYTHCSDESKEINYQNLLIDYFDGDENVDSIFAQNGICYMGRNINTRTPLNVNKYGFKFLCLDSIKTVNQINYMNQIRTVFHNSCTTCNIHIIARITADIHIPITFCLCDSSNLKRKEAYHYFERVDARNSPCSEIGVGFEVEKEDEEVLNNQYAQKTYQKTKWAVERDGSLDDQKGFEIVSPILDLYNAKDLEESIDSVSEFINAKYSDRCGGHIHVSSKEKSPIELLDSITGYLPLFYAIERNRALASKNSYAKAYKKDAYKGGVRGAFNLTSKTLEFRIFSTPENVDHLLWRVELLKYILSRPPLLKTSSCLKIILNPNSKLRSILNKRYPTENEILKLIKDFIYFNDHRDIKDCDINHTEIKQYLNNLKIEEKLIY